MVLLTAAVLIAACACTDFHDNILVIIRILGKKQNLHLFLKFLNALLGIA